MIILEHAQSDPVHRRWERAHKCVVQLVRQPCAPRLRCRAEVQQFILMSSSEAGNLPARSDTDKDSRGFVRDFRSPARADGVAWERVLILPENVPEREDRGWLLDIEDPLHILVRRRAEHEGSALLQPSALARGHGGQHSCFAPPRHAETKQRRGATRPLAR